MDSLEVFCRQVRARSNDNRYAVSLMFQADVLSQVMSILRQEVDSMIRVIYLLTISDMNYRHELIEMAVRGDQWTAKGSKHKLTDREMVDVANTLTGWTESVYRFGCAFIHLSNYHDYRERDPMTSISDDDKKAILNHLRHYHGGPDSDSPTVIELAPFLPKVFHKIADNLEYYLKDLEAGKIASHLD